MTLIDKWLKLLLTLPQKAPLLGMIQSDTNKAALIKTVNSKTWGDPKRRTQLQLTKTIALKKGENF